MNTNLKVKTLIRRPSRYQKVRQGYELTCSGFAMANAIHAVRQVEEDYSDVAASMQEGASVSPAAWDSLAVRHAATRAVLARARNRASSGLSAAKGTRLLPTTEAICR